MKTAPLREEAKDRLIYIDDIHTSDRNKSIYKDFASGDSRKIIAERYSITTSRVRQLIVYVDRLIRHSNSYPG